MAIDIREHKGALLGFGVALGAALLGMAWVGSKGEVHVPPPPPDRDPRTDYLLGMLVNVEDRIAYRKKVGRGYHEPATMYHGDLKALRDEYKTLYRRVFGEDPSKVP